jgi:glycosyltransferase involved in cell wall biosynthesis
MNKLPISVCIISGAEARRIGRTLESVHGWTGEIIMVLNEEVRDGTEEIAAKYGAKVFREPWKGHIAQKNSAVDKASQEWLLGLDADEVISPGLREEIIAALGQEGQSPRHAAFNFPRLTFYCGGWIRHGEWYPDRNTRLWRRGSGRWGGENPHDRVIVAGREGKLRGDLLHYTAENLNQHILKLARYGDIFVSESLATGRSASTVELYVRPAWRFFRGYVLRLGFLDGWRGYYIAWLMAFYTMARYARLREATLGAAAEMPVRGGKASAS